MWSLVTDRQQHQQGPAVVFQLSGTAREVCREVDADRIAHGGNVGQAKFLSGLGVILRALTRKFGELEYETNIITMHTLLHFTQGQGETIDQTLSRFDVVRHRAANHGGLEPGPSGAAYLLMNALKIPPGMWASFLQPIEGRLPETEDQLNELLGYIRRQSHLI